MSKYFKESEYVCPCGCGISNMSEAFLEKLDKIREIAGVPMVVTSGCRCAKHNKEVGGKLGSSHLASEEDPACAVDISAVDSHTRFRIFFACTQVGVQRMGLAKSFIHIDDDKTKPQETLWLY